MLDNWIRWVIRTPFFNNILTGFFEKNCQPTRQVGTDTLKHIVTYVSSRQKAGMRNNGARLCEVAMVENEKGLPKQSPLIPLVFGGGTRSDGFFGVTYARTEFFPPPP